MRRLPSISRSTKPIAVVAGLVLAFGACSSGSPGPDGTGTKGTPLVCDVELPTECSDPSIGYDDIEPILKQHCIRCHGGTPGVWPLTSYDHVASWAPEIRSQIGSCGMPPTEAESTITTDERERLLLWVRCGAKE